MSWGYPNYHALWKRPAPAPFLLPRIVENQVKLNEYIITKGTKVLANVWAIGRDPTIWEDSLEFKPERFLASQIDFRGQDFELIPWFANCSPHDTYDVGLIT